MARHVIRTLVLLFTAFTTAHAYWLMGIENFITTERLDPIVNPGKVSGHAHSVLGGSNFRMNTNTAALRQSECTSIPIAEDKSNYWFPHLYFQHANGDFTSLNGGAVIDTPGATTAFPDDFRMLSGDPTLRTYDPNSFAQQAITFLCLDFNGVTTRHNSLPAKNCPSGVRAQVNFPSCWDGKNTDSPDHKSHVAFLSEGPDKGSCKDPKYPVTLPRIFIELYWSTADFDRSSAMNTSQPFVFAYGDPTGYGYHADFLNGWDKGVLQNAVDKCHCNIYGDPQCCADQKIFTLTKGKKCRITKTIDEQTTGTLKKLPGNNPVQKEGVRATMFSDPNIPTLLSPVYAYTGDTPTQVGKPITPPGSAGPSSSATTAAPSSSSTQSASSPTIAPQPSSSSGPVESPMPSQGVPSSSSVAVSVSSSKPVAPTTVSSTSVAPTTASSVMLPPASGGHNSHFSSAPASTHSADATRAPLPTTTSSGENADDCDDEEDDGEDEEDNSEDDGHSSPAPTSVSTRSAAPTATTTKAPSPTSASEGNQDDCEDEEDSEEGETDNSGHSTPNPSTPAPSTTVRGHSSPSQAHATTSAAPTQPASSDADDEDLPFCDELGDDEPAHTESVHHHSHPPATPAVEPTPVTTLALGGASPTVGNLLPVASAHPSCAAGKFRHQRLREAKALREKRALRHVRSHHDRFMRSHHHARAI